MFRSWNNKNKGLIKIVASKKRKATAWPSSNKPCASSGTVSQSSHGRWIDMSDFRDPSPDKAPANEWEIEEFTSEEDGPTPVQKRPTTLHQVEKKDAPSDVDFSASPSPELVRSQLRSKTPAFKADKSLEDARSSSGEEQVAAGSPTLARPKVRTALNQQRLSRITAMSDRSNNSQPTNMGVHFEGSGKSAEGIDGTVTDEGCTSPDLGMRLMAADVKRRLAARKSLTNALNSKNTPKATSTVSCRSSHGPSAFEFASLRDFSPDCKRQGSSNTSKKFTRLRRRSRKVTSQGDSEPEIDTVSPAKPPRPKEEDDLKIVEHTDDELAAQVPARKIPLRIDVLSCFPANDRELAERRDRPKKRGYESKLINKIKERHYWFRTNIRYHKEDRICWRVRYAEKIYSLVFLQVEEVIEEEYTEKGPLDYAGAEAKDDRIVVCDFSLWRISGKPEKGNIFYTSSKYESRMKICGVDVILPYFFECHLSDEPRRDSYPPVVTIIHSSSEEDDPSKWHKHLRLGVKPRPLPEDCLIPVNKAYTPPTSPDNSGEESCASTDGSYHFFNGALEDGVFTQA